LNPFITNNNPLNLTTIHTPLSHLPLLLTPSFVALPPLDAFQNQTNPPELHIPVQLGLNLDLKLVVVVALP